MPWVLKNWKLIVGALVIAALVWFGWYVKGNIETARRTKELEAAIELKDKQQEEMLLKSQGLEEELAKQRAYVRRMEGLVTNEINKNDVYRNCIVPLSGLRLINEAIKPGKDSR